MIKPFLVLKSQLSRSNLLLTPAQEHAVELAMLSYATLCVEQFRENEVKNINREAARLLPSIIKGELKLYIRNWYLKRAKKQAQMLADTTNRKHYVIRKTEIAYIILSTQDVELNKKLRILGKNVGAVELTAKADFIAHPLYSKKSPVYIKKVLK